MSAALGGMTDTPDALAFPVGTSVRKSKGYGFPGVVVSAFRTLAGKERYVVECTEPAVAGMLHVFNAGQLEQSEAGAAELEKLEARAEALSRLAKLDGDLL